MQTTAPVTSPTLPSAAPPTRAEIERKLSFKSAAQPRVEKKKRSPSQVSIDSDTSVPYPAPSSLPPSGSNPLSINTSAPSSSFSTTSNNAGTGMPQSSSTPLSPVAGSSQIGGTPGGPLPGSNATTNAASSGTGGPHGLSAIAERLSGMGIGEEQEDYEYEEEHEHGNSGSEAEGDADVDNEQASRDRVEQQRGLEDERVLKSGYLYKKQEKRKVWKKKWFVLRVGKLAYYKDDREYSLSRAIDLRQIHTAAPVKIKKHSFTFGIVTKERTFLAEASSQNEMDDWVNAIAAARKRLTENLAAAKAGSTGPGASGKQPGYSVAEHVGLGLNGATTGVTASPAQIQPAPHQGLPGVHYPTTPSAVSSPNPLNQSGAGVIGGQGPGSGSNATAAPISIGSQYRRQPSAGASGRSARREPSASSLSSTGHGDYLPRTAGVTGAGAPVSAAPGQAFAQGQGISSDSEDEDQAVYFSDIAGTSVASSAFGGLGAAGAGPQSATPQRSASMSLSLNLQGLQGMGSAMNMNVDPSRVIMSGYLMKRSHGRGRKVWRKRWWVLTSAGLTYAKSHMDTKTGRHIPLSIILDALEQPADDSAGGSDSGSEGYAPPQRSGSKSTARSPSMRKGSGFKPSSVNSRGDHSHALTSGFGQGHRSDSYSQGNSSVAGSVPNTSALGPNMGAGAGHVEENHTFKLVTAKRTYTLCAPSEEDEIKWLAGVKALLNREREKGATSPTVETVPRLFPASQQQQQQQQQPSAYAQGYTQGLGLGGVPRITQQPPTPSLSPATSNTASTNTVTAASNQPTNQQQQPQSPTSPISLSGRGRSATYTAKSAVEEVGRRYHPERAQAS